MCMHTLTPFNLYLIVFYLLFMESFVSDAASQVVHTFPLL